VEVNEISLHNVAVLDKFTVSKPLHSTASKILHIATEVNTLKFDLQTFSLDTIHCFRV